MQIDVNDPNATEIIAATRQLSDAINRVRSLPAEQAEELLRFMSTHASEIADDVVAVAAEKAAIVVEEIKNG
jgi:ABC-type Fe3+-hydroxamate transport system substrate-binding protein